MYVPPLYHREQERDSCGVGFVADVSGRARFEILDLALRCVTNLTHRGALDADARTGDGAGVMLQVPRRFFFEEARRLGGAPARPDDVAVGMIFLPGDDGDAAERCREAVARAAAAQGMAVFGWREVPVDPSVLGEQAARSRPQIEQLLLGRPEGADDAAFERALYLARRAAERWALAEGIGGFYVPSFSHRTIVYKGLLVAHQLSEFYEDLRNPAFETSLAVFHQRYSTNTLPNWFLAHPYRFLAHNGEINTLQGNRNWLRAREPELHSAVWGERIGELLPIIQPGGSDSASLDNALEMLVLSGRDIRHALMMLVPEAWENMPNMPRLRRDFYEYHACLTEPWDGPAAIAFSDGTVVGATLDRNGLRPARYVLTEGGLLIVGSEVGMVPVDERRIVEKGRLGPGQMIAVDTARGALLRNDEIKDCIAGRRPYGEWVATNLVHLDEHLKTHAVEPVQPGDNLKGLQAAFGYTREEIGFVLKPMAAEGKEAVGSMGDDTPLAVMEARDRLLYSYFKQKFAQVTNPPIDPIREELVMSLDTYLGRRRSLLEEEPAHARLLHLASPLMINEEIQAVRSLSNGICRAATLEMLFPVSDGPEGLRRALERLCRQAVEAVDAGKNVLILTDRGVDAAHAPIPALLATGAVHHHLIREGRRMRASLVVETGEARDVHQIALLIGYGASAVNPYLALETVSDLFFSGALRGLDLERALANYETAVDAGLLKIISKMGISTISAYHGAQIFEAIGLSNEVVDLAFAGTPSRVGGATFADLAAEVLERHAAVFGAEAAPRLREGGFYRFRREGEYHAYNPEVVKALHDVARSGAYDAYKEYSRLVHSRPPTALRDLLDFRPVGPPISVTEVEPVESIVRRFVTTAMSLGALSPEAHQTLAVGMNRLGARSNTGEGGEEPDRFWERRDGDSGNSKIKQVASARFGVTPAYLAAAEELEIKMAQGSKPGEGGQLPGHKVSALIASVRHTLPGTPLISPPPHHDIYSIEDLAELIHDLKQANPRARVAVKLVAEEGVGTIAAGVAKGYADIVHISGGEGGTGASPLSSIKNAGVPLELGLAEAQQVLVMNELRSRVTLRADGGLKTGRDVVVAAMLGADEYGFGTAALVAIGCQMARQCHLNTCPVGVASQRPDLRAKFPGRPEHVVAFFHNVAQEVREILAGLGARCLDDVIGRTDLLCQVDRELPRGRRLDLSALITPPPQGRPLRAMQPRNDRRATTLDERIIADAAEALDHRRHVWLSYQIANSDRAVGARLSGEIARRFHHEGLPEGTIEVKLFGTAGQSFGAFLHKGVRLILQGDANDYVGKGMGGGEIAIRPPALSRLVTHKNVIVGNTCLYGATGGSLFAAGRAGERFAVRNSGARAVVEGVGDHGCEYMTEGVVVVLGETGRNFGAGMSNGIAYVLDETGDFPARLNPELVAIKRIASEEDEEMLRSLILRHVQLTASPRGQTILNHWETFLPLFWKVAPHTAISEEGPMTVIHRHLASIRAALAMG